MTLQQRLRTYKKGHNTSRGTAAHGGTAYQWVAFVPSSHDTTPVDMGGLSALSYSHRFHYFPFRFRVLASQNWLHKIIPAI